MAKSGAVGGKLGKLPEAWQPPKNLPSKLGDCIDLLVQAKRECSRLNTLAEAAKKEMTKIEEHIFKFFEKSNIEGARGRLASVTMVEKDRPKVVDKEEFGKYVALHGAWDMLYGRAVEEACQLRWEEGEEIPGVEKFHDVRLSIHEVK